MACSTATAVREAGASPASRSLRLSFFASGREIGLKKNRHVRFVVGAADAFDALIARERSFPSVVGHGVVVPHVALPHLPVQLCAAAALREDIDLGDGEPDPIRLVFLVLSQIGDPLGHLATLRDIARLVSNAAVREEMLAAVDATGLLRAVRRAHERSDA